MILKGVESVFLFIGYTIYDYDSREGAGYFGYSRS